jgi:Zn-dependent peptidase ImmA (M78 family)
MRRGFKAQAERIAERVRTEAGKKTPERFEAMELAKHVGAQVRSADQLTDLAKLQTLEELQPGAFSACTFTFGDLHIIVLNPLASLGRQHSDVAHEVAHILLQHAVKEVQQIGGVSFFTCDPDEEQEANWLAGCLLLPRPLLLRAAGRGMNAADIAEAYGVSEQMAAYRLRITGVERQLQATRRSR